MTATGAGQDVVSPRPAVIARDYGSQQNNDRDGRRNEWAVHTRVKGRPVMSVERARTASEARGMARRRLGKDRMPAGTTVERVV